MTELNFSLNNIREIINQSPVSFHILEVDENHNTLPIWINKKYTELIGVDFEKRAEIGFSNTNEVFYHPDDLPIIQEGINSLMKDSSNYRTAPFRIKHVKNGDWKWIFNSSKQININNKTNYLLCNVVDIDESIKYFEKQILSYTSEIKRLKREVIKSKLTKTEIKIIYLLIKGKTIKEIAIEKNRSSETINNHKRNIFKKLNIHKTSELIALAIENGLGSS